MCSLAAFFGLHSPSWKAAGQWEQGAAVAVLLVLLSLWVFVPPDAGWWGEITVLSAGGCAGCALQLGTEGGQEEA